MHDLELVRAFVDGTLPEGERAAFAARLREEPELAELAEAYGIAVEATGEPAPAMTTTFEQISLPRSHSFRLLATAALVLLAVGVAAFWSREGPPREPPPALRLASIPLQQLPEPPTPPEWPRALLDHETTNADGLVWYDDFEEALAVAKASSRPALFWVDYPGCPLCKIFREDQCRNSAVGKAAEDYVLLNLSWDNAPKPFQTDPRKGWPAFHLLNSQGEKVDGFLGLQTSAGLTAWLGRAKKKFLEEKAYEFYPWDALQAGARKLDEAGRTESVAGKWLILDSATKAPAGLGAAARARLAELTYEAQAALFAARAAQDIVAAQVILADAGARFHGTPVGDDLRKVLEHIERFGSFPELNP